MRGRWERPVLPAHGAPLNATDPQQMLARPHWANRLTPRDRHALTPLIWEHVNPYGRYELHMTRRIEALA